MKKFLVPTTRLLGVVAVLLVAEVAFGQTNDGKVKVAAANDGSGRSHQMVIWNGANRTVRIFPGSTSPGEMQALRDLERAENELANAENLQLLRQQYISNEMGLEARRHLVQVALYGRNMQATGASQLVTSSGNGFGYPYAFGVNAFGYPASTFALSSSNSLTQGLGEGVGREGALKEAFANVVAQEMTPDYLATATRNYSQAVASLGAPADKKNPIVTVKSPEEETPAKPRPITVTLKDGKTVKGVLLRETSGWIVVQDGDDEIRLPLTEVTRMSLKSNGK